MIRVDPGAQRTDAFQESRNLLLSTDAHADAIPGLEIEADDVRCTHAAAVAQVDPEQLFYLRARGLDDAEAKQLVIEGFLQELVERAHEGPIRETLRDRARAAARAPARGRLAGLRRAGPHRRGPPRRSLLGGGLAAVALAAFTAHGSDDRAEDDDHGYGVEQPQGPVAGVGEREHGSSITALTHTPEQDIVGVDSMADPLGDRVDRALERPVLERRQPPAALADRVMVVMAARDHGLVARAALPGLDPL